VPRSPAHCERSPRGRRPVAATTLFVAGVAVTAGRVAGVAAAAAVAALPLWLTCVGRCAGCENYIRYRAGEHTRSSSTLYTHEPRASAHVCRV